jgi:hypothetical protein
MHTHTHTCSTPLSRSLKYPITDSDSDLNGPGIMVNGFPETDRPDGHRRSGVDARATGSSEKLLFSNARRVRDEDLHRQDSGRRVSSLCARSTEHRCGGSAVRVVRKLCESVRICMHVSAVRLDDMLERRLWAALRDTSDGSDAMSDGCMHVSALWETSRTWSSDGSVVGRLVRQLYDMVRDTRCGREGSVSGSDVSALCDISSECRPASGCRGRASPSEIPLCFRVRTPRCELWEMMLWACVSRRPRLLTVCVCVCVCT